MVEEIVEEIPKDNNKIAFAFMYIVIILILLLLILFLSHLLYLNIPGSPESLNVQVKTPPSPDNRTFEVKQFHPNMKFNHNRISYRIENECNLEKSQRVVAAFQDLKSKVGIIDFYQTSEIKPDITISCSEEDRTLEDKEYFIAGEGGAKEIVQTGRYNVITNGIILLYDGSDDAVKCDWPNIELHELIHVFGFGHSEDENSLMYPYLKRCDQSLDQSIVNELKRLYSEENKADLYFEDVYATKKGRYLDFNLTIKNSGTLNADKVLLSIFDNGELVETRDLEDLKFGAGIFIEIQNLKLIHRNPDEIKFVIDKDDLVDEIDEENNIATVRF